VPNDVAFGLREVGALMPGVRMEMEFRRGYKNGIYIGHLVGYLGEIDERELRHPTYALRKSGDLVGKMGLEKSLDERLRGVDGGMVIEVDSVGRLKRIIRELPYQTGSSVYLTIDSKIQKAALEGLSKTLSKRGAAVAINVQTGAVLSWLSYPAFDPSQPLGEQLADPNLPFFDRVYRGSYPPGSIFKVITAMAGFERSVLNTKEIVNCVGFIALKDKQNQERRYRCWEIHNRVNFWGAMQGSCDSYFYLLGQKIGSQDMYDMARQFGMGENAQDIFPAENSGNVPSPGWKRKKGLGGWSVGDTLNMSIGQGFITASPLQMVQMMAAVATKGQLYRPYVVQKIVDANGVVTVNALKKPWRTITVNPTTWQTIDTSLHLVVSQGTGRGSYIPYLNVRGKTGTAQNPHGEDHAWFAAYAGYPNEEPTVAVVVFVENGGGGGSNAAPIAKQMLEAALPPRNVEPVSLEEKKVSWAH
jgi:penicillin-binding protein 2